MQVRRFGLEIAVFDSSMSRSSFSREEDKMRGERLAARVFDTPLCKVVGSDLVCSSSLAYAVLTCLPLSSSHLYATACTEVQQLYSRFK